VCECVSVSVCVCERERERESTYSHVLNPQAGSVIVLLVLQHGVCGQHVTPLDAAYQLRQQSYDAHSVLKQVCVCECVCVCVRVCVYEYFFHPFLLHRAYTPTACALL
jgi:hypothetical protein